jgi:hypothetical protein
MLRLIGAAHLQPSSLPIIFFFRPFFRVLTQVVFFSALFCVKPQHTTKEKIEGKNPADSNQFFRSVRSFVI